MHTIKAQHWFALAVAFGFAIPAAHAEMITPDSIPNPPSAIASTGGTPVPLSNLVSSQYSGMGLNFSYAAISHMNGLEVWAPAQPQGIPASGVAGGPLPNYPPALIGYMTWLGGGNFVVPGTLKPTSVYSTTLEIVGAPVTVEALNSRWQEMGSVGPDGIGPHGGNLYTLSGGGIRGFTVSVPVRAASDDNYPAWGVAEVSFTNNPEPSSLVLAGLGVLGLVARSRWRRIRGPIE